MARNARAVAAKGERDKRAKYGTMLQEFIFVPFVIESTGVWGGEALNFVREIGRRIRSRDDNPRAADFIRQRIAVELQRGNARLIAGGLLQSDALGELGSLIG